MIKRQSSDVFRIHFRENLPRILGMRLAQFHSADAKKHGYREQDSGFFDSLCSPYHLLCRGIFLDSLEHFRVPGLQSQIDDSQSQAFQLPEFLHIFFQDIHRIRINADSFQAPDFQL